MRTTESDLFTQLNQETGKLGWKELERHFAHGVVVKVGVELDLVEVAAAMARDDKNKISTWMGNGLIARADDQDALRWGTDTQQLWAVVVAPWVLVQEILPSPVPSLSVN